MTGFMFSTETMGWIALSMTTGFGWLALDKAKEKITS